MCKESVLTVEEGTELDVLMPAGEFGIVYKARLSLPGRSGKDVAVKTLKGWL